MGSLHLSIIHILPCLHMDSFTSQTNTNWFAITLLSEYPVCHPSLPLVPYILSLGNSSEKALTTPPTSVSVTLFIQDNFLTSSPTLTEGQSKAVTTAVLEWCFENLRIRFAISSWKDSNSLRWPSDRIQLNFTFIHVLLPHQRFSLCCTPRHFPIIITHWKKGSLYHTD